MDQNIHFRQFLEDHDITWRDYEAMDNDSKDVWLGRYYQAEEESNPLSDQNDLRFGWMIVLPLLFIILVSVILRVMRG